MCLNSSTFQTSCIIGAFSVSSLVIDCLTKTLSKLSKLCITGAFSASTLVIECLTKKLNKNKKNQQKIQQKTLHTFSTIFQQFFSSIYRSILYLLMCHWIPTKKPLNKPKQILDRYIYIYVGIMKLTHYWPTELERKKRQRPWCELVIINHRDNGNGQFHKAALSSGSKFNLVISLTTVIIRWVMITQLIVIIMMKNATMAPAQM